MNVRFWWLPLCVVTAMTSGVAAQLQDLEDIVGPETQLIRQGRRVADGGCAFASDGLSLVFAGPRRSCFCLSRVDLETGKQECLTSSTNRLWSPSVASDGTIGFLIEDPGNGYPQLAIWDDKTSQAEIRSEFGMNLASAVFLTSRSVVYRANCVRPDLFAWTFDTADPVRIPCAFPIRPDQSSRIGAIAVWGRKDDSGHPGAGIAYAFDPVTREARVIWTYGGSEEGFLFAFSPNRDKVYYLTVGNNDNREVREEDVRTREHRVLYATRKYVAAIAAGPKCIAVTVLDKPTIARGTVEIIDTVAARVSRSIRLDNSD